MIGRYEESGQNHGAGLEVDAEILLQLLRLSPLQLRRIVDQRLRQFGPAMSSQSRHAFPIHPQTCP